MVLIITIYADSLWSQNTYFTVYYWYAKTVLINKLKNASWCFTYAIFNPILPFLCRFYQFITIFLVVFLNNTHIHQAFRHSVSYQVSTVRPSVFGKAGDWTTNLLNGVSLLYLQSHCSDFFFSSVPATKKKHRYSAGSILKPVNSTCQLYSTSLYGNMPTPERCSQATSSIDDAGGVLTHKDTVG